MNPYIATKADKQNNIINVSHLESNDGSDESDVDERARVKEQADHPARRRVLVVVVPDDQRVGYHQRETTDEVEGRLIQNQNVRRRLAVFLEVGQHEKHHAVRHSSHDAHDDAHATEVEVDSGSGRGCGSWGGEGEIWEEIG